MTQGVKYISPIAFAWGRVWQAGDTCLRHYEDDDSCDGKLVPVVSQPKADTGTLIERMEQAVSDLEQADALLDPLESLNALRANNKVYMAREVLRDALTELRKEKAEIDRRIAHNAELFMANDALKKELAEARASSPDLRGLVEKWRQAARREASPSPHDYGFNKGRLLCADELEATLTGTGEPTNGDV